MTSIYCGMCGTMVPDGGHPCYARQQVQTTDYPSSHGVTQYLPPSCKNSTAHYQGCECHEESWKQRLDLERQEILELRAEITKIKARLMAALKQAQNGLDLALSCGLPPSDISGRQMWQDSEEIRRTNRAFLSADPQGIETLAVIREAIGLLQVNPCCGGEFCDGRENHYMDQRLDILKKLKIIFE